LLHELVLFLFVEQNSQKIVFAAGGQAKEDKKPKGMDIEPTFSVQPSSQNPLNTSFPKGFFLPIVPRHKVLTALNRKKTVNSQRVGRG